jgi:hypothetical protein
MTVSSFLPLFALLPGYLLASALGDPLSGLVERPILLLPTAALLVASLVPIYAVSIALLVRLVGRSIRPGWHGGGRVAWASWTCENLLAYSRLLLFPLYSTIYARPWLRLLGLKVGRRAELSTAIGLGPPPTTSSSTPVDPGTAGCTSKRRAPMMACFSAMDPAGVASKALARRLSSTCSRVSGTTSAQRPGSAPPPRSVNPCSSGEWTPHLEALVDERAHVDRRALLLARFVASKRQQGVHHP